MKTKDGLFYNNQINNHFYLFSNNNIHLFQSEKPKKVEENFFYTLISPSTLKMSSYFENVLSRCVFSDKSLNEKWICVVRPRLAVRHTDGTEAGEKLFSSVPNLLRLRPYPSWMRVYVCLWVYALCGFTCESREI